MGNKMGNANSGILGLLFVTVISLLATWMDALSLQLAKVVPWAQLHSLSHLAMALVCLCLFTAFRSKSSLKTSAPVMMVFRSLTAVGALGFYYLALKTVSLTEFVTVNAMIPLVAGVVSTVTFQDRLGPWAWVAILLGCGSVIFGYWVTEHEIGVGFLYALLGLVFSVLTMQAARYIQLREQATVSLVFYPALCVSLVPFFIAPEPMVPLEGSLMIVFVIYILLLIVVRLLTMYTLRQISVVGFGLFLNLQFIWAILIDVFYFLDQPEWYEVMIVVALVASVSLYIFKNSNQIEDPSHGKASAASA